MRPLRACKSFGLFLPELGPRLSRPFFFAVAALDSLRAAVAELLIAIEQEGALA